jgi:hypothetical protein
VSSKCRDEAPDALRARIEQALAEPPDALRARIEQALAEPPDSE